MSRTDTFNHIVSLGFTGRSRSGANSYMNQVAEQLQIDVQRYNSASPEVIKKRKAAQEQDYMKRSRIFKFLWMNEQLEPHQKEYLLTTFPVLGELYVAIQEFRQTFNERSLPFLHLFVDKFKHSELNPIASFARGLENDIEAIENAVTSPFSNGFVEGTISKLSGEDK
jgi:transposase